MKNRLSHLRWWAEKVGKAGVIPADNLKLGIPPCQFATGDNKATDPGGRLDHVADPHVRLRLDRVF